MILQIAVYNSLSVVSIELTSCKGSTVATPGVEGPWLSRTGRTAAAAGAAAAAAADDRAATLTWRVCARARDSTPLYTYCSSSSAPRRDARPWPAPRWTDACRIAPGEPIDYRIPQDVRTADSHDVPFYRIPPDRCWLFRGNEYSVKLEYSRLSVLFVYVFDLYFIIYILCTEKVHDRFKIGFEYSTELSVLRSWSPKISVCLSLKLSKHRY